MRCLSGQLKPVKDCTLHVCMFVLVIPSFSSPISDSGFPLLLCAYLLFAGLADLPRMCALAIIANFVVFHGRETLALHRSEFSGS